MTCDDDDVTGSQVSANQGSRFLAVWFNFLLTRQHTGSGSGGETCRVPQPSAACRDTQSGVDPPPDNISLSSYSCPIFILLTTFTLSLPSDHHVPVAGDAVPGAERRPVPRPGRRHQRHRLQRRGRGGGGPRHRGGLRGAGGGGGEGGAAVRAAVHPADRQPGEDKGRRRN